MGLYAAPRPCPHCTYKTRDRTSLIRHTERCANKAVIQAAGSSNSPTPDVPLVAPSAPMRSVLNVPKLMAKSGAELETKLITKSFPAEAEICQKISNDLPPPQMLLSNDNTATELPFPPVIQRQPRVTHQLATNSSSKVLSPRKLGHNSVIVAKLPIFTVGGTYKSRSPQFRSPGSHHNDLYAFNQPGNLLLSYYAVPYSYNMYAHPSSNAHPFSSTQSSQVLPFSPFLANSGPEIYGRYPNQLRPGNSYPPNNPSTNHVYQREPYNTAEAGNSSILSGSVPSSSSWSASDIGVSKSPPSDFQRESLLPTGQSTPLNTPSNRTNCQDSESVKDRAMVILAKRVSELQNEIKAMRKRSKLATSVG